MRILIAAVGKMKTGPGQELFTDYTTRLPWKLELKEIPPRGKAEEARLLMEATAACHKRVLLDERGKALSSRQLADQLKAWQLEGDSHVGFIIGGADGVADELRARAHLVLAFGALTWPHMLARVMLAEQIYRAFTLLSGHPYHRE